MKLHGSEAPVAQISGSQEATAFKFKMTAQAVQMLSSGLYSNPRKAIIRELSCNAHDAHCKNKNPERPFQVSLPGRLSPELIIRDFGTGLSHDAAMNLYTTYFESDKSDINTNEDADEGDLNFVTGALGLGSKSPLGYTNNYTVTSFQDGKKRIYSIFIDSETGMPCCAYAGEFDTDEENGLEVRIPTKENDSHEWQRAAKDVYRWFPVMPILDVDLEVEPLVITDTFGQVDLMSEYLGDGYYSHAWIVKMGNVPYPLEFDRLNERFRFLQKLVSGVINVKMGDVMFTPSREALFYNTATIECIEAYLDDFLSLHNAEFRAQLSEVKTLKDVAELFARVQKNALAAQDKDLIESISRVFVKLKCDVFGLKYSLIEDIIFGDGVTHDGKCYRGTAGAIEYYEAKHPSASREDLYAAVGLTGSAHKQGADIYDSNFLSAIDDRVHGGKMWTYEKATARGSYRSIARLTTDFSRYDKACEIHVVVNDLDVRSTLITRTWLRDSMPFGQEYTAVIYFDNADNSKNIIKWLSDNNIAHEVTYLSDTDVESYRKTSAGPRASSKEPRVMVVRKNGDYNPGQASSSILSWERGLSLNTIKNDTDMQSDYAWMEVKGYDALDSKVIQSSHDLEDFVRNTAPRYGLLGVVAVKTKDVDQFKNDSNWTHIDDAVKTKVQEAVNGISVENMNAQALMEVHSDLRDLLQWLKLNVKGIKNDDIADFVRNTPAAQHTRLIDIVQPDAKRFGIKMPEANINATEVAKELRVLYNKVPCLKTLLNLDSYHTRSNPNFKQEVLEVFNKFTMEEN